jgi:hypothetical protein
MSKLIDITNLNEEELYGVIGYLDSLSESKRITFLKNMIMNNNNFKPNFELEDIVHPNMLEIVEIFKEDIKKLQKKTFFEEESLEDPIELGDDNWPTDEFWKSDRWRKATEPYKVPPNAIKSLEGAPKKIGEIGSEEE